MRRTASNNYIKQYITLVSSVGTGESWHVFSPPPPEIGKIVVETCCYLPKVYTFREEAELQEIASKTFDNFNFPERF